MLIELGVGDPGSPLLPRSAEPMQELMRAMRVDRAARLPAGLAGRPRRLPRARVRPQRAARSRAAEADAVLEVGRLLAQSVRASRVLETEQRLVQELRELARYRSELIATISHELKTPLTAILGHAELHRRPAPRH